MQRILNDSKLAINLPFAKSITQTSVVRITNTYRMDVDRSCNVLTFETCVKIWALEAEF